MTFFAPHCFAATALALTMALDSISIAHAQSAAPATTAAQRALKQRGFYAGQETGSFDEATRSAVRRFQIREGLQVTGQLDAPTIQALQTSPSSRPVVNTPPARTSVREKAHAVVQSDREFLERVESVESAHIDEPAPPPVQPPPKRVPARASTQRANTAAVERSKPARPGTPPVEAEPAGMTQAEASRFVQSYLAAAEKRSPESEVSFFADKVDYFSSGKVSRSFIAKDQRSYYSRWPNRDFTLVGAPKVIRSSDAGASLRFRVRYALGGGGESARGEVENFVRLKKAGNGYKIAAIRERKLK